MIKKYFLLTIAFTSIISLKANNDTIISDSLTFIEDLEYVKSLDSNFIEYQKMLLSAEVFFDTSYNLNNSLDSIITFEDSIYKERIEKLNKLTPIELVYNSPVKAYIDVYAKKYKDRTATFLGLGKYYFPMFEEYLDKYNIPLELKYLAIVESALNPRAKSKAGATGLWQFMYATAKMHGLKINSYVDERQDPIKSTEAACQYLQKLYTLYDDWSLALAAYNAGPGNVNKAIRRSGNNKNYWIIRPYLPRETRSYVPAFIAVNYIMNYASEHNIVEQNPLFYYYESDTITVSSAVSFSQISELLSIDIDNLKFLNPSYKIGIIPGTENFNILNLPSDKIGDFINNEELIYSYGKENEKEIIFKEETVLHYRVKSGDCLGSIAQKNNTSVRKIMDWNNLRSSNLRIGQTLLIYKNDVVAESISKPKVDQIKKPTIHNGFYIIRQGDTLWDISKATGVSIEKLKEINNITNANSIKPGMKIKVS